MEPIRILAVDDNATLLKALCGFLRRHDDLLIVGTAEGGKAALAMAQTLQPQVVLLDWHMSDMPGLQVIPCLRAALPEVAIVMLTLHDDDVYRRAALAAGADDLVAKATLTADLAPTIRRVALTRQHRRRPAASQAAGRMR